MAEMVVQALYSKDGKHRVLIVQRDNGSFGFEEEYFSEDEWSRQWCRYSQNPFSICDSADTALREAKGRVQWLNPRHD